MKNNAIDIFTRKPVKAATAPNGTAPMNARDTAAIGNLILMIDIGLSESKHDMVSVGLNTARYMLQKHGVDMAWRKPSAAPDAS